MLKVNRTVENEKVEISLEGELDTVTAPEFEAELREVISGATSLVLDLEKLEYISSAGLRVLLIAQKAMNQQGEMKVVHVNDSIMDIFEVTGFSEILTIE
ncbi:MAG: STAS domain-containing protein [Oscillospiraceae bacterium]|nr:STAS domain-containing protein [Oscillospiraceae bacterium]